MQENNRFNLAWIGYKVPHKDPVPEAFTGLNIEHLFLQLPLRCQRLTILILQDCQDISEESYMSCSFKEHIFLKLLCVAYNIEALSPRCITELLKYAISNVHLEIRGNNLTDGFH
jgi:hypothetical protein